MRGDRRRFFGTLALLTVASLSLANCGMNNSASTQAAIKIGMNIELSGDSHEIGEANNDALILMQKQINEKGVLGRKIKLVVRDNKSNPGEAKRISKDLAKDNVSAIIGGGASPTALAMVDVAEESHVPMVSTAASPDLVAPLDQRRYVFKTPADGAPVAQTLLADLKQQHISDIGVLSTKDSYGNSGVSSLRNSAGEYGINIAAQNAFSPVSDDIGHQAMTLKKAGPDAIVVWAQAPDAARAVKAVRSAGFAGKIYLDPGAGAELFLHEAAGKESTNVYMVHPAIIAAGHSDATSPSALRQKQFYSDYSQRFGHYSGFASYGADALNLIVSAIKKADSADPAKISAALEKISYDGLTGTYDFSKENHGGVNADALAVLTVRNGSWVTAQ